MARDTHTYTLIEGMWSHATQTTSECGLSEDGHETRSEQPQCIEVLCICAAQDTQHILEDKKTLCSSKSQRRKIDFRFTHKGTLVEAVTQSHGRKEKKHRMTVSGSKQPKSVGQKVSETWRIFTAFTGLRSKKGQDH